MSDSNYRAAGKLVGKAALITGADSGIGREIAIAFAKEGADVAVMYLNEHDDANEAKHLIEQEGCRCLLIPGDIGDEPFCQQAVELVVKEFGHLDIVVNNAGEQHPQDSIEKITAEQLERTFRTNIFAMFYIVKAALKHLKAGSTIINTTSITAYQGNHMLIDYSASKGAIVAFTRSLSRSLVRRGIRVDAVAPGPIWTPLIAESFPDEDRSTFGTETPMGRAGKPKELAPSYVFLASDNSSFMTGQVLHVNGGEIIGS